MTEPRDIPSVPDSVAPDLRRVLVRMREELQKLQGFRGDGSGRAITLGDASGGGSGGGGVIIIGGGGGGTTPDLTPPPTPSALAIFAGITQVTITWSGIGYPQGHGHKQTIIYAVQRDPASALPPPVFSDAVMVATAPNALTIISIPSEPNIKWHVWARFETNDGAISIVPAGGTNGVQDTTGQDVAHLLEILTGEITQAQLFAALGARIDLIDGAVGVPGSVDFRINAMAGTLTSAFSAADGAVLTSAATYTQTWAYSKSTVDSALTTLGTTITAAYSAADSATLTSAQGYVNTYAYSKATVDSALSTLSSTITAAYTAADGAAVSAAVATSATAIAGLDGAVHALYTVRVQVTEGGRTVVGGFGLSATPGAAGGSEIEFGVRADRFYIGAPAGTTGVGDILPFVVQTTDQTVNGVLIPKGVYMDAAYIKNLTALVARLGAAWIDNAMIANMSAAKITAGSIDVGAYIQSTGFVSGTSGWRIHGNGNAEFAAASIRGQLVAAQIDSAGLSVRRAGDGTILLYAGAGATPPWVVNGESIGGGIELTTGVSATNTVELRSLVPGDGIDLSITSTGAVQISSRSSDDSAKRLVADSSSTSTSVVDVASDFLLPLEANTTYRVEGSIMYRSAAAGTGLVLAAKLPAAAVACLRVETNTSQTGAESRILNVPTGGAYASVTFSGSWAATAAAPTTFSSTQDTLAVFEGIITTGAGAGSFQLGFASEVSGSNITIRAGTSMLVERIRSETAAGGGTFALVSASNGNFGANYTATAISTTSKPRTATRTLTLNPLGGWTVTVSGSAGVTGTGAPTSSSWSSPTGSGAGEQWQVQFVVVAQSTSEASISNGAATYQTLNVARSITVTANIAPMDGIAQDVVTVDVVMREISTGTVTTLATVDLEVYAESF